MLVAGFGGGAEALGVLRGALTEAGHQVEVAPTMPGLDHAELLADRLITAVAAVAAAHARPVVLVGHSRGGQLAALVSRRRPDLVAAVVTLASPLTRFYAPGPRVLLPATAIAVAGTFGAPGLVHIGCLWRPCCRAYRADLTGPFPPGIPLLSVYSRTDRLVPWRATQDPAANLAEVTASHEGILHDRDVHRLVTGWLAQLAPAAAAGPAGTDPQRQDQGFGEYRNGNRGQASVGPGRRLTPSRLRAQLGSSHG